MMKVRLPMAAHTAFLGQMLYLGSTGYTGVCRAEQSEERSCSRSQDERHLPPRLQGDLWAGPRDLLAKVLSPHAPDAITFQTRS